MAFCSHCGKELPAGALVCPNCGTPVAQTATPPAPMSGFDTLTKDSKAQDYWLKRLVAFVIDAIIVYAVLTVIAAVIALPFLFLGALTGGGLGPAAFIFGGIFSLLSGLVFVLYFTVAESSTGASIGKRIFNLKVASKTGTNPGLGESFVRNLSKIYWLLLLLDVVVGLALSKGYQQKYSDQFLGTSVAFRSP